MSRLFDVSTEEISLASPINIGIIRTVLCWVNPTSANATRRWAITVGAGTDYNLYFGFGNGSTNEIEWGFENTSSSFPTATFTTGWAAATWHCMAGTYDGSTLRLFTKDPGGDLVEQATVSNSSTPRSPASPEMLIGNIHDGSNEDWDGRIANVFIIDGVALSIGELRTLATLGRTRRSVTAFLPLFGNASPEPDYSGNERNGTITGATQADHAPTSPPFGFDLGWMGAFVAAAAAPAPEAVTHLKERHYPRGVQRGVLRGAIR